MKTTLVPLWCCGAAAVALTAAVARAQPYSSLSGNDPSEVPSAPGVPSPSPTAALDEAMGGKTLLGTPVSKRTMHCFPAEAEDVFWEMDQVATLQDGNRELRSLDFDADADGQISERERDAIRGRNTWLL